MPEVNCWRWTFVAPGPPLIEVLKVGEALRRAATRIRCDLNFGPLPQDEYRDVSPEHRHIFWLPGDENGDGLIDHAWACCANGLSGPTIAAFAVIETLRSRGRTYRIAPSAMGVASTDDPFAPARVWQALSPYVTPQWRLTKTGKERKEFTPDAQLKREIVERGLPVVRSISWQRSTHFGDVSLLASSFTLRRRKEGKDELPPNDAVASFPTITFSEPVAGPLAFGYGAHFGLGQMMPVM